jgi:hypothetical protein
VDRAAERGKRRPRERQTEQRSVRGGRRLRVRGVIPSSSAAERRLACARLSVVYVRLCGERRVRRRADRVEERPNRLEQRPADRSHRREEKEDGGGRGEGEKTCAAAGSVLLSSAVCECGRGGRQEVKWQTRGRGKERKAGGRVGRRGGRRGAGGGGEGRKRKGVLPLFCVCVCLYLCGAVAVWRGRRGRSLRRGAKKGRGRGQPPPRAPHSADSAPLNTDSSSQQQPTVNDTTTKRRRNDKKKRERGKEGKGPATRACGRWGRRADKAQAAREQAKRGQERARGAGVERSGVRVE